MKKLAAIILTGLLVGCSTKPSSQSEIFTAAPSSIDQTIGSSTIEDYILALPPFEFHEDAVDQFRERVRGARATEARNRDRGRDSLFVDGGGSWPAKDFVLDRSSHTLRIHVYPGEGDSSPFELTMQRVPGGWRRGPIIKTL
jgi:hypothetical protein